MRRGSSHIPKGLPKDWKKLAEDWKKLAEAMRAAGWTFEEGKKHPKAFAPDGIARATLSRSPSDWRAFHNERAKFRRWCRDRGIEPGI